MLNGVCDTYIMHVKFAGMFLIVPKSQRFSFRASKMTRIWPSCNLFGICPTRVDGIVIIYHVWTSSLKNSSTDVSPSTRSKGTPSLRTRCSFNKTLTGWQRTQTNWERGLDPNHEPHNTPPTECQHQHSNIGTSSKTLIERTLIIDFIDNYKV